MLEGVAPTRPGPWAGLGAVSPWTQPQLGARARGRAVVFLRHTRGSDPLVSLSLSIVEPYSAPV